MAGWIYIAKVSRSVVETPQIQEKTLFLSCHITAILHLWLEGPDEETISVPMDDDKIPWENKQNYQLS